MSIARKDLIEFLNELLRPEDFIDYGPNGLQIEGKEVISKMAFAVSATADSVQKAVDFGADAMIVHHGLFWKFHGTKPLIGPFYNRVAPLIKADINLLSYHLPLDAHSHVGNAASIANLIGLTKLIAFGDHKGSATGVSGSFPAPIKAVDLKNKLEKILNHDVYHASPKGIDNISSIGIITGGANGDWVHALEQNLDAYLTGEMSEHDWHESQESNIHMFAGGHHATEKFGIQNLQELIKNKLSIEETLYIDSSNPA
ncbi:MAG: Nif3-like dinuclear metal center hexameric protein [Bacteriovoracaceae bacterium]|jgi:dinuclear metal center YbgI/SA1388 family protein|nr:Nif3-like dinuclear metal center hexameric protein [Bacteriovoracaceae bacterium]